MPTYVITVPELYRQTERFGHPRSSKILVPYETSY